MWEAFQEVVLPILLGTLIVFASIMTPVYFIEKAGCNDYSSRLSFEHDFSFTEGCVIKTGEGWIKSKNYIITKEEK